MSGADRVRDMMGLLSARLDDLIEDTLPDSAGCADYAESVGAAGALLTAGVVLFIEAELATGGTVEAAKQQVRDVLEAALLVLDEADPADRAEAEDGE